MVFKDGRPDDILFSEQVTKKPDLPHKCNKQIQEIREEVEESTGLAMPSQSVRLHPILDRMHRMHRIFFSASILSRAGFPVGLKGKGVNLLHCYGDQLWGIGAKSKPDTSFTLTRIFPQVVDQITKIMSMSTAQG